MKKRFWIYLTTVALLLTGCDIGASRPFAVGRDVLFADDFVVGQTGKWLTESDEKGRTAVVDEKLIIVIDSPNTLQFSTLQEPHFDDFIFETEAALLDGPTDGSYGILFRMQGPNQFYRFEITADGSYIVERRNADATWTRLVSDWTESAAIRQGVNATNRLRVVAVGAALAFYINEELVHRVQDNTYSRGAIALDAGTFGQGGVSVAFDHVIVRKP